MPGNDGKARSAIPCAGGEPGIALAGSTRIAGIAQMRLEHTGQRELKGVHQPVDLHHRLAQFEDRIDIFQRPLLDGREDDFEQWQPVLKSQFLQLSEPLCRADRLHPRRAGSR